MEQELEVAEERHPVRFLVRFAVFAGVLYLAGRFLAQKKNEYAGLTESEAKQKLVDTIGPKLGDETAEDIAEQVIPKLKERGLVKSDPMDEAVGKVKDAAKDVGDKVSDTAKTAAEKVGDVAKDAGDKVSDTAKSAADKAKDAAKGVGDKVSEAVDEVTKD